VELGGDEPEEVAPDEGNLAERARAEPDEEAFAAAAARGPLLLGIAAMYRKLFLLGMVNLTQKP
jgi:hypothetical protein